MRSITLEQFEKQPEQQFEVAIKWSIDQDYTIYIFDKDELIDIQKQFEELKQQKRFYFVEWKDDMICIFNKADSKTKIVAIKQKGTSYFKYVKGMYLTLSGENKSS